MIVIIQNLENDDILSIVKRAGEEDFCAVNIWNQVVAPRDAAQNQSNGGITMVTLMMVITYSSFPRICRSSSGVAVPW